MGTVRAAICDDEPSWLEQAESVLVAFGREAGVALELSFYSSSADLLAASGPAPDVLFCDIELGGGSSGIDLVRMLSRRWPRCQIVYVTNFLRYAPDVYVTEHLWFALKDRFADRLPEIMEKLERKTADDSRSLVAQTLDREIATIPCPHIAYLERRKRITAIITDDGHVLEVPDRLTVLLERLPSRSFARCHASYLVNFGHVRLLRRDELEMDDGSTLPVSRRFARGFRDRYLDWADDHAV